MPFRHRPNIRFKAALAPLCACLCGLLASPAAHAVRPFFTDDARIVDYKACQIESGIQSNRDSTEYRVMPACNFTGNLELTVGGARTNEGGSTRATDEVLQAKTLFKPLETNGWGWGLTVGNSRDPQLDRSLVGNLYATVPVSFSFFDDRAIVHANLGWLHDKALKSDRMTWGVASEVKLAQRVWLIGEVFGQDQGHPAHHVGMRYALVPGHIEIDAAYGNRFGTNRGARWFVVGLRLVSPAFLP